MTTLRFCSHCNRPLTDAVSLDLGVGPICRGIENEVYAKAVPADDAAIRAAGLPLLTRLHECAEETRATVGVILTTVLSSDRPADLRATVKRLDWCCSYLQPQAIRTGLLQVMRACGYQGLAAIITGKACTTPAEVTAVNGRIIVKGSKNGYASAAFRGIVGWKFDHAGKFWSFPAASGAAVKQAVGLYYPATKTDVMAVAEEAKLQAPAAPAFTMPAVPVSIKVVGDPPAYTTHHAVVTSMKGGKIILQTAAYFPAFVAALKELPEADRCWNLPSAPKAWTVAAKHAVAVQALLQKHFNIAASFPVAA